LKSFVINVKEVPNSNKNDDINVECRIVANDGGGEGVRSEGVRGEIWFQQG
jgi:hypothetical protein